MKHSIYFLFIAFTLIALGSCKEEDDIVPSTDLDVNGFAPASNDNSETAQIRNAFFSATGSYLLFSDTLTSTLPSGEHETLDPYYGVVGTSVYKHDYRYKYITDVSRQHLVADVVQQYFIPKLGKASPYSFLLVDDIYYYFNQDLNQMDKMLTTRAYIIKMSNPKIYQNPDSFFTAMLKDIIIDKIGRLSASEKAEFLAFSSDYYGRSVTGTLTDQQVWDLGMFYYVHYSGSSWQFFYYESTDWSQWVNAALTYTPEEFEAIYGSSAVMIRKFAVIRKMLLNLGYNI